MIDELAIQDWIDGRLAYNRVERRDSLAANDKLSASCSVGAMLELHELRSFLIKRKVNKPEGKAA